MQLAWSRIETRVAVSISYDDNRYTMGTFCKDVGNRPTISGRVIPKTQKKMVLDASLLNTQHYKVRFKGKVEQYRERSSALSYTSV